MTPSTVRSASSRHPAPHERGVNPFATRYIRPDAGPFLFRSDESADRCVDRLASFNWRGQIVGPHGSGKSTLLESLIPMLEGRGRRIELYRLRDDQRRLPATVEPRMWTESSQIVIDGYEQLSAWSRWGIQRKVRRARAGLLITGHAARCGFPIVYRTSTDPCLLQRLVDRLVANTSERRQFTPDQVTQAFTDQRGNLREALLQLYDVWELSPDEP